MKYSLNEFLFFIIVFVISYSGVRLFRRWSLRREIFDIPNERSSHTVPTPRGGGVVIVAICLIAYFIFSSVKNGAVSWAYLAGALLIAFVSWFDDLKSISFYWRFVIHSISALLIIGTLGYFQEIEIPYYGIIDFGKAGAIITFIWIVWLTNAYNFMDGIDGIAGLQAVVAGMGWWLAGNLLELEIVGLYSGVIAVSSLGFLLQNWQPAKIFMGDVGSAFLGYTFAVLPFLENAAPNPKPEILKILPFIACLVVWFFVFDTVYTLIRRIINKERIWEAHRTHIYQKMVIGGYTHQTVTLIYGAMTLLTIFTVVLWIQRGGQWMIVLLGVVSIQTAGLLIGNYMLPRIKR